MNQDQVIAEAIRLGTANLKEWQEYGKKWKARYDEMIETLRITGDQRNAAKRRVEELEDALNRIFHATDCTTGQIAIIDEVLPAPENLPQNASSLTWCRNAPSHAGRPRNSERESTRDPIGRVGEGDSLLSDEITRCNGIGFQENDHWNWREGCETCLRRTASRSERVIMMTPPPIIAFECEFLIEPPTPD